MEDEKRTLKSYSTYTDELEKVDSLQGRIQWLVNAVGNPNAFAKQTDLSVSGVKRYLDGGEPTASKIIQIANKLGINASWLLTGEGHVPDRNILRSKEFIIEMPMGAGKTRSFLPEFLEYLDAKENKANAPGNDAADTISSEFALIPGYSIQVSAGQGALNGDHRDPSRYLAFRRKWLKFRGFSEKDLVIVWAKGDSMEPTIHNNDTVVVHTGRTTPHDGHMYIFRNGDELFVKRYQSALGTWRLISDNPVYPPLDIKKEDQHQFEVVGQVVHVAKDFGE